MELCGETTELDGETREKEKDRESVERNESRGAEPAGGPRGVEQQVEGERQNISLRGRKRTRNEEKWTRNVNKRLKNNGKPYMSSRGKEEAGKAIKQTCSEKCSLRCSTKFNEEDRQTLFKQFWASADRRDQHHFLLRHVQELPVKRIRVGSEKRTTTFHYYFYTVSGLKKEICRTFFIHTLDITKDLV
ncbi:hypothetical protein PoB_003533800 [Plakobranchus ocellatus]|uniref:Uncharacterized protein n=1 Tax=Plakobranchus ocellatus TaxID=259542 RepID=A0AAV4AQJ0_9GAST|nr:hypothetical protein PoB_003533800 [Plakobranchus ocellatus]